MTIRIKTILQHDGKICTVIALHPADTSLGTCDSVTVRFAYGHCATHGVQDFEYQSRGGWKSCKWARLAGKKSEVA